MKEFSFQRLRRRQNRRKKQAERRQKRKKRMRSVPTASSRDVASGGPSLAEVDPFLNNIDPILLVPIPPAKEIRFRRESGLCSTFNVESLHEYIMTSGDFRDPITRIEFSEADLNLIDAKVRELGAVNKDSVLALKSATNRLEQMKSTKNALLGIERCAGEVVTKILEAIEEDDFEDAQLNLALEFPNFSNYFEQIKFLDQEFARQCTVHWIQYLRGPPNRPTQDQWQLLQVAIQFLESHLERE